jgi:putative membrane protein
MSEPAKETAKQHARHRRPATFRLDDPGVVVVDAEEASRPARGTIQITPQAGPAQLPAVV